MDKERSTVMKDPGMERVFSTQNKKFAEQIARESGGVIETLRDAIKLVAKHPANRPRG